MKKLKRIILLPCICFLVVATVTTLYASAYSQETPEDRFEINDKSVQEVLKTISQSTGYEILMVGNPGTRKINGIFYLSDLEKSLRRIFKGTNTFIEFYENDKRIIVKLPGETVTTTFSGSRAVTPGYDADKIDPDTGLTHQELLTMRQREKEEQMLRMNDPEFIDPDAGVSYYDQMQTREREKAELNERMSSPGEVDPTTGMSYAEQSKLQKKEAEERAVRMSNPGEIDPSSGVSYAAQVSIREQEQQEITERTSNPDEIDPDTGMTYGEIMQLREKEKK